MAETLRARAVAVLLTAEPDLKAAAARKLCHDWAAGTVALEGAGPAMPDRPARPPRPPLLAPSAMPKRGKAGSARTRAALLHALAHIELNAIDLAIDMAGRWGPSMPEAFTSDWLRVADDEARHFGLLTGLMAARGTAYGDLPAHDGLWDAARATAHDLAARLAIVPQVLEARGLDVTPPMIARFEAMGDGEAADVLAEILADEITHVGTGNRWFRKVCSESVSEPCARFRSLVETYFRGAVKPPFNVSAREKAGLAPGWYNELGTAVPAPKPSSTGKGPLGASAGTEQR